MTTSHDKAAKDDTGTHEAGVRRAEDLAGSEAGRQDIEPQGRSQRPAGTSTARDATGVDPQDPVTTGPERTKG